MAGNPPPVPPKPTNPFQRQRSTDSHGYLALPNFRLLMSQDMSTSTDQRFLSSHTYDEIDDRPPIPPRTNPPVYLDKLLFQHVPEDMDRSKLELFLEVLVRAKPTDVVYGEDPGDIVVTFDRPIELYDVTQACKNRPLENGVQLSVSRVPVSTGILVENVCPTTSEDTVLLHFESPRNNGGPVLRVDPLQGYQTLKYIVWFQDKSVVARVLKTSHTIDKQQVTVRPYLECLGPSGGSTDPGDIPLPPPLDLEDTSDQELYLLKKCPAVADDFQRHLAKVHARMEFFEKKLSFVCTVTGSVPKPRQTVREWEDTVKRACSEFLNQIQTQRVSVSFLDVWVRAEKELSAGKVQCPPKATFMLVPEAKDIVVIGLGPAARELFESIYQKVRDLLEENQRRALRVTETISRLEPFQLRLLKAKSFHTDAMTKYTDLTAEIDVDNQQVIITGLQMDVNMVQQSLHNLVKTIRHSKLGKMSDSQRKTLQAADTIQLISTELAASGIIATWEWNKGNDLCVYAFSSEDCSQAAQVINQFTFEAEIEVKACHQDKLQSRDWMNFMKTLLDNHTQPLWLSPLANGRRIAITGRKVTVQQVKAELCEFLREGNLHTEIVWFSPSRQRLISRLWQQDLENVEASLKRDKVSISFISDNTELSISGTREGVRLAKRKLEELDRQRILCHEEKLTDKAHLILLASRNRDKHLDDIGRQHQCVISLVEEPAGLLEGDAGLPCAPGIGTDMKGACSNAETTNEDGRKSDTPDILVDIQTPPSHKPTSPPPASKQRAPMPLPRNSAPRKTAGTDGTKQTTHTPIAVHILEGEIAKEKVDVVVNTTSSDLDLGSGAVSSSILKAAGPTLQADLNARHPFGLDKWEVAFTGGHGMACKEIFHLVLDGWSPDAIEKLSQIVRKCLEEASRNQHTSISFPALGTGRLGYPREEVAQAMFNVVDQFDKTRPSSSLKEVRIVIHAKDDETVQAFRRVKQVGRRQGTTVPAPLPANPKPPSPAPAASVSRIIQILVMEGQIADQQVDVIVNSTSPDLDLKSGAVSSSLLRAAGPQLQAECTQKYPKGIQPGHIAFSRGFRLPCKEVYHLALEPWHQGMEEELGSVIYYCLETADEKKYTSIAFPALGTGKLGYPCDKVAQTMFRVVDSFEQVRSTLSLREVRIVIYQDQQTLQAFRDAEKRTMGASSAGNADSVPRYEKLPARLPLPVPLRNYSGRRQDRVFPNSVYNLDLSPSRPRSPDCASEDSFDIRGLGVEIVKGELTEQAVDVIVVAVNGQLQIEDAEDLKSKGVAVTGSYTMKCGRVMFLNVAKFGHDAEKAVTKCLKEAEARTAKTLAIPPLGADVDNAVIAAKALHKAVTKFTGDRRYVQSLRVITNDWFTCRTYVEKIRDKLDKSKSKAIEQLPPARRSPVLEARSLFVYCHRIENADSAMNRFKELAAETVIEKKITDDNIRTFSTQQIADVKEAGLRRGVEVDVSPQTGEITVRGDRDIMVDAVVEITQTVTAILGRQNQKRAAHFAASFVQWYFLEVTTTGEEQKEYGQMQNHVIEEAFSKGQKTIRLTDVENTVYVIDFDVMKEYPEENPSDTVNVIRREKLTGGMDNRVLMTLPSTWTSQASNASVAVIPLKANDQEFKEVERNLLKTQGNHNVQVKQVLRIQNPTLYQQYAAKKSQIEHQNPRIKNERTLWHGTSVDAVHNINSYGFNRSYCGKNATKFGEGVYFAVNSEYSLNRTFTPADCSGNRYMYQCKVLSGYSTAGRPEMRCLPARQGNVLYDSAVDDTLKPEMFIIFNDTQAYPEYLITFTESG